MLLALAWRNLWRNRRRTLLTVFALATGIFGIVGIRTYRESTFAAMVELITTQLVGHLQIHAAGYQDDPALDVVIADPVLIEARLKDTVPQARPERRVLGAGLGGSASGSTGVLVTGVDPRALSSTSLFVVKAGRGLSPEPRREVVLGTDLATQLGVQPGGELVLVGQSVDGGVANDRFDVVGLVDAGTDELNNAAVFLHLQDAQAFFGLGSAVHAIVVHLPGGDDDDIASARQLLHGALDLTTVEALSWSEMLPELKGTIDTKRKGQRSIDVIVFIIVGLGALNAMTMATLERTREFGVMLAVGERPGRLLGLVLCEALWQAALGLALGLLFAVVVIAGLGEVDLSGIGGGTDVMGLRMPAVVRLEIEASAVWTATVVALSTMLAGALLPALRASRLRPVDAMRGQ